MAQTTPQVSQSTLINDDNSIISTTLKKDSVTTLNIVSAPSHDALPTKGQITDIKETVSAAEDANIKPSPQPPVGIALKYDICTPLLRFPLTLKKLWKVNTFTPISINFFEVLHYMDTLMASNIYFLRLGLPWHPLLSRLYCAEIFYIQVLRTMRHARIGSSVTRLYIEQLLKDFPPESLPIPGPLIPILQAIASCSSDNPLYGMICPTIPNDIGTNPASDLLRLEDQQFILPNIPVITAFLNTIIHANGDIPDYSDPTTFDDSEDHVLLGHNFESEDWQNLERLVLLSPGLNCTMESFPEIDEVLNFRGQELNIPVIQPNDNLSGIERFMLMDQDSTWFKNVIDVMSIYCSFFNESSNLGACSPNGPTSPLVRSRLHNLSSRNADVNVVNTLTHAFPGEYPFQLRYEHRTFETTIPQTYSLMGQLAAVNTSTHYRGLNVYGNFNNEGTGRIGPYWTQTPSHLDSKPEDNIKEVETIVASHYYKEQP